MLFRRHLTLIVMAAALTACGCSTPQSVKDASTAQLSLIDALDKATQSLNDGLGQFAADEETLILQERRVTIAQAAIEAARTLGDPNVTIDGAFEKSNRIIRPSVDMTLQHPDEIAALRKQLAATEQQLATMPQGPEREDVQIRRNKLALKAARFDSLPQAVKDQEAAEVDALATTKELRSVVDSGTRGLRLRIAVLRDLAAHVDTWLKIDLSPSQGQVDQLQKAFSGLIDPAK